MDANILDVALFLMIKYKEELNAIYRHNLGAFIQRSTIPLE
jgi:hypothetical protein